MGESKSERPQVKMWACTFKQKPTFYLHPDIHGIVGEKHAAKIAADVMGYDLGQEPQKFVTCVLVDIDS